jgi:murein DD-endopeptidase MepM/ murein hydrolase activator NlpD
MTHFLQRTALILLASTALCVTPAVAAKSKAHAAKAEAPPTAANGKIVTLKGDRSAYVVKKGDTLEKIADKLDTTIDELLSANKLKKTSVLQPGDVVKGPVVTKKAYVVSRGDTVFSIAKRFHVTVDELREENDLSAKTSIKPGQQIRLPADYKAPAVEAQDDPSETADKAADAAPAKGSRARKIKTATAAEPDETAAVVDRASAGKVVTVEAKGETYKARKGDTLAKIADHVGTDINELKRLNRIKGTAVKVGQVYRGPSFAEHIYTAQAGETLASIAQRFGVSVERLRAENEFSKRVISVRQGQKLYLPEGYRDRTAAGYSAPSAPSAPTEDRSEHYPTVQKDGSGLPARPQPYQPGNRPYVAPSPSIIPQDTTPAPTDAQVSQAGKGKFQWPLRGTILSDFGPRPGGQRNDGINIQAAAGDAVHAAADGEVIYAGDQVPGFGNLVLIKHPDGWATAYAHLARIDVKNQQKITQGQQIGQVGTTGGVPEPQLHFEVRYAGNSQDAARKAIDPKLVLPK